MKFKTAKRKINYKFWKLKNTKKLLLVFLFPGSILMFIGVFFSQSSYFYIIGWCIMMIPLILDSLFMPGNTYEFNTKWIPDRWVVNSFGDFIYHSSYEYFMGEKMYDIYEYSQDINININFNFEYEIQKDVPREFKLVKEKTPVINMSNIRFATEKEIIEYRLDAYIAKILLEKDDDKYKKTIK